jgi:hypothetical protein
MKSDRYLSTGPPPPINLILQEIGLADSYGQSRIIRLVKNKHSTAFMLGSSGFAR